MIAEQILNIIEKGEGVRSEFKLATNNVPSDLYETVVSFSNTMGGTILLGISDDGIIAGIDTAHKNSMIRNIVSALNSIDNISPPLYLQPSVVEIKNKYIICLQVPVSSQVHKHKEKVYIREYESDINITNNHNQISDLYLRKSNTFSENKIYPNLAFEDLDKRLLDKARNLIRSYQSDHPWLLLDDFSMLKEAVLWKKDFNENREGYTLAAALLFGKDTTIQSILPAYKIEVLVRRANADRWDDRITLRTNLIDSYIKIKDFLNKHLPEKFYIEADQRIDLRDTIFREIIGNIIVHREYNASLATEIIIDKYKITATNPNRPNFIGPIDLNSFNPFAKNPNIRKFFMALGWTDEIGSGIRNTKKYLPLYSSGAMPEFIEDNIFKTIIPLSLHTLKTYAEQWMNWLDLKSRFYSHIEMALDNIPIDSGLHKTDWESMILYLVPGWNQKGTKLDVLKWAKYQPVIEEEIKKVPGWNIKSTKLLHKKSRYIIAILSLTAVAISLEDMMSAIGYINKKTFRDNYIKPLEQIQFISKTNLTNLTAPDQKYILKPKGKLFIANRIL